jgi:hypothetical protein
MRLALIVWLGSHWPPGTSLSGACVALRGADVRVETTPSQAASSSAIGATGPNAQAITAAVCQAC